MSQSLPDRTATVHLTNDDGEILCDTPATNVATMSAVEYAAGVDANRGARACRDCVTRTQREGDATWRVPAPEDQT